MPMISASTITEVRIWRREAPIVRKVANSRVRWAIVIPSVFAITKAPTKSAMPGEGEQEALDERGEAADRLLVLLHLR